MALALQPSAPVTVTVYTCVPTVGLTVVPAALPPLLQLYVYGPAAPLAPTVIVEESWPAQMAAGFTFMFKTGFGSMSTNSVVLDVQPFASVPVTDQVPLCEAIVELFTVTLAPLKFWPVGDNQA